MITIIKEVDSVLIFSVRKFDSNALYSVELTKRGNNETTQINLSNPDVYAGRALKFVIDLSEYKEGTYSYRLLQDATEVDFGDFYIKDLNSNNVSNVYK